MSGATPTDGVAHTLTVSGVRKEFDGTVAVDDVTLAVRRGELVTLLGPSGSGKTTLLRLVAGFEAVDAGEVLIDGKPASRMTPADREIGMVFQHYALFPHLSVADNIGYGLKVRGWDSAKRQERVEEMLKVVGLTGYGDRLPRQLSGGQQQRVALARALAFYPAILLMDEPLGALDRELRMQMVEELRRLHRELGVTAIYVTHDQEEALAVSDRVAIMREGRLIAYDTPRALFERPTSLFVAQFLGRSNVLNTTVLSATSTASELAASGTRGRAPRSVRHFVEVEWEDRTVQLPASRELDLGEAWIAVPPHALALVPAEGSLEIGVTIEEILFLGELTQLRAASERHGMIVARVPNHQAEDLELGARVILHVRPEAMTVIGPDGTGDVSGTAASAANAMAPGDQAPERARATS